MYISCDLADSRVELGILVEKIYGNVLMAAFGSTYLEVFQKKNPRLQHVGNFFYSTLKFHPLRDSNVIPMSYIHYRYYRKVCLFLLQIWIIISKAVNHNKILHKNHNMAFALYIMYLKCAPKARRNWNARNIDNDAINMQTTVNT